MDVTIRKFGNSLGILLPKQALHHLRSKEGERLYLVEAEDGYRLTRYDPGFAAKMAKAEHIMDRYKNTLRRLAE